MANFRMKVGINRGRGPVDFKSLSALTEEINSFLRKLGEDAGVPEDANRWFATKVADGSFLSDAEIAEEVTAEVAHILAEMMDALTSGDASETQRLGVREQTRLQFANVARRAESAHMPVEFGLYNNKIANGNQPDWRPVTTERAQALIQFSPTVDYVGALQGVIHAWFKESDKPHFQLREFGHGELVNCYYRADLYPELLRAFVRKDEVVHVSGMVRANRIDKSIDQILVSKIRNSVEFSDADFERFFGCAPDMTGDFDSVEFIERGRKHDA